MNLDDVFARARAERRAAFIPYVMAGDPDLETTAAILNALNRAGADAVELGIPYGDPLADGPTIAAAGVRALERGTNIEKVLAIAGESALPVVLFSYYNPVLQYGLRRFAQDAKAAGVAGVIVPDVAFEESTELRTILGTHALAMPLLVSPSTPLERARAIAQASTGFVYVVSRLGVTGAASVPDFAPLKKQLLELRTVTRKPLAVGFGVSKPEHVREVASDADAIIVGSALLDAYGSSRGAEAARAVEELASSLRSAAEFAHH